MLHPNNGTSIIGIFWNILIGFLFLFFIKSTIELIANDYYNKIKSTKK